MVTVTFYRREDDRRITQFMIAGHAKFAKHGRDIVCAAISAISVGTVNAIEELVGLELPASMKDGWLSSTIPSLDDGSKNQQVQLLLESMRVMLTTIETSYGKYVQVREQIT